MSAKLSWEPHLHGATYCSPACGRGCTLSEYKRAERRADRLTAAMTPATGWEPRVWENLGWHFETKNGHLRVMASGVGYTAYLGSNHASGGTPPEAVISLYSKLMGEKAALDKQIMTVVQAAGITPWRR